MFTSESDIVDGITGLSDAKFGDHSCEHLKATLMSYDADKDGALNHDELANMLHDTGNCGFLGCGYFANKILDKLDGDHSGGITWAEYLAVSSTCSATDAAPPAGGSGGAAAPPPAASGPHGLTGLVNKSVDMTALNAVSNATAPSEQAIETTVPQDDGIGTGAKVAIGVGAAGLLYLLFK